MYQYEFERIEMSAGGYSLFGGVGMSTEGHQEIIQKRAEKGWRLVCSIPVEQRASGFVEAIELVFEKKIEES